MFFRPVRLPGKGRVNKGTAPEGRRDGAHDLGVWSGADDRAGQTVDGTKYGECGNAP